MGAGPYIVVHLEDPKGSGRAACNGMLFESPYGLGRRGDVLWLCTGCSVVTNRVRDLVAARNAEIAKAVREMEPCCNVSAVSLMDGRVLRAMCQCGSYVEGAVLAIIEK